MSKTICSTCEPAVVQPSPACGIEDGGCGCSHSHGEASRESGIRDDIISIAVSAVIFAAALFIPEGWVRSAAMTASILVGGLTLFWQGLKNVFRLKFEELSLLTIAVIAACILGEFPEAVMVTLLFRVGELLEDLAVSKSRREIEALTNILPEHANLIGVDGSIQAVSAKLVAPGSKIQVKPGEKVPLDCVVLEGSSTLDTSSLTGESVPREASAGDTILSGMVNQDGVLICETQSAFDDSTASKIVEMVKESAAKKGNTERLISKFARVYTPAAVLLAVLVAVIPPLAGLGSWSQWIGRALVFLVASCPCALVISIPLSYFAGIGAASKKGILIKGSKYVESLAKARCVVFDKTGTLTTGRLEVSRVEGLGGVHADRVLELAAIAESYSNHPIAKAVVLKYGVPNQAGVTGCREITSYGMSLTLEVDQILCGSGRLMEQYRIDTSTLPKANIYLAQNGTVIGFIEVSDMPRPEARDAIAQLKAIGISHTAMLTGDHREAADIVRQALGIDQADSDLLPQDKVSRFEAIKSARGHTLFVGDGINDSPVLARADAGIAMGLGTDAAIEAADVVLMSDNLASLPLGIRIARRTNGIARFNMAFALAVKLVVFVLAVFGMASMWMAVFADVGVSILAVLNATRALRVK